MSKQSAPPICKHPDHVTSYFSMQKGILAVITVSGLIYNLGLMARPWFEGQMIQCLFFIQKGQSHFSDRRYPYGPGCYNTSVSYCG